MDNSTTVMDLRQLMAGFVAEREWSKYHSPKNLSMSLAIEAAELMEHFQWISGEESRLSAGDPQSRQQIADEMADVFCYLLSLANTTEIDLASAVFDKVRRNGQKYPVEKFRGKFRADPSPENTGLERS
jgi:dCTP diphosphatase